MPKDSKKEMKSETKALVKEQPKEKSKHNAATDKAGLSFNVNTTKNWIKKQFEVVGMETPKFHGAHVAITAVVESLLMSVLSHVNSHLPKDKSSLYKITLPALSYPLQLDSDYSKLFKDSFTTFDGDTNYTDQFWMSKSDVNFFIESHFGDNIQLEAKAYNMLSYLLLKYAVQITRTSGHLMTYAGKKTLEPKAVRTAVLIHTPETVANTIVMKLDDAVKNSSESDEGDDEEEQEEEVEAKKGSKKQAAKEVSESDESEEEDAESEPESESEPEEKPVAKAKKADKVEDKKAKAKK
jgi:hypothetical protein